MATVIDAAELTKSAGTGTFLKELKEVLNLGKEIIDKAAQIHGKNQGQNGQVLGSRGSPAQIPTSKNPEVIIQKELIPMELDKEKVKAFLRELIEVQASKLPGEIQEKKVSELVGENFKSFSFTYKGLVTVDSDTVIDGIADKLIEFAPKLCKEAQ